MRMLAVSCGLLLAACGSSSDAGLFGSTQSGTGGANTGGGAAVGGSTAGSSGNGGLASGGSGNSGTGATTASGGSGATGGNATGGETGTGGNVNTGGTGGDGTGGEGTGGNPAAGAISCGGVNNCKRPHNFCCVFLSGTALPSPTCQANGAPCFPGTDVLCDGPEDCINGTVCCGQLVNSQQFGQAYNDIQCKPANECEYSKDRRVICGDSKCPGGLTCKPSSLLPNINYCSPSN